MGKPKVKPPTKNSFKGGGFKGKNAGDSMRGRYCRFCEGLNGVGDARCFILI